MKLLYYVKSQVRETTPQTPANRHSPVLSLALVVSYRTATVPNSPVGNTLVTLTSQETLAQRALLLLVAQLGHWDLYTTYRVTAEVVTDTAAAPVVTTHNTVTAVLVLLLGPQRVMRSINTIPSIPLDNSECRPEPEQVSSTRAN